MTAAVHNNSAALLDLVATVRARPSAALLGLANWAAALCRVHGERTGLSAEQVVEAVGMVLARQRAAS